MLVLQAVWVAQTVVGHLPGAQERLEEVEVQVVEPPLELEMADLVVMVSLELHTLLRLVPHLLMPEPFQQIKPFAVAEILHF
jgi:hypothetical protein